MTAYIIPIIILSLTVLYLCYKLIPLMIELGKLRNESETMVVPELKHLRRESESLLRDIEKLVEGDKYVTDIWKERIEQRKNSSNLFQKLTNIIR